MALKLVKKSMETYSQTLRFPGVLEIGFCKDNTHTHTHTHTRTHTHTHAFLHIQYINHGANVELVVKLLTHDFCYKIKIGFPVVIL